MGDSAPGSTPRSAASVFEALKLDLATIKLILLTAIAVLVLLSIPLFFILKNFVTFDALDNYFKVTDSVRPKIVGTIAEELYSGYSKNFVIDSKRPVDNSMLFYTPPKERVLLTIRTVSTGTFPALSIYLNDCLLVTKNEQFDIDDKDVTSKLDACGPDSPNLNALRIVLPDGPSKDSTLQVKCLVLVTNRIHAHLEQLRTK
jgi:hypothetical protein